MNDSENPPIDLIRFVKEMRKGEAFFAHRTAAECMDHVYRGSGVSCSRDFFTNYLAKCGHRVKQRGPWFVFDFGEQL